MSALTYNEPPNLFFPLYDLCQLDPLLSSPSLGNFDLDRGTDLFSGWSESLIGFPTSDLPFALS